MDPRHLTEVIWRAQTNLLDLSYNKEDNIKGESRKVNMADLNTATITGRLTKDPELKTTPSGKEVVSFSVAVNGFKEGDTHFFDVTAWEKTAQLVSKYFHKGSRILVHGSLQHRTWEKDGKRQSKVEINAREIVFIDPKQDTSTKDVVPEDVPNEPIDLSSIPF